MWGAGAPGKVESGVTGAPGTNSPTVSAATQAPAGAVSCGSTALRCWSPPDPWCSGPVISPRSVVPPPRITGDVASILDRVYLAAQVGQRRRLGRRLGHDDLVGPRRPHAMAQALPVPHLGRAELPAAVIGVVMFHAI